MIRGVFLDRDGTVCEDVGYLDDASNLKVYPFAVDAIRRLNAARFCAILVTNQSGVARGFFDEAAIGVIHDELERVLAAGDARLDGIYYCPHHPTAGILPFRTDCDCRKPRPGLLLRASDEHGIDLAHSYVVGDKYSDVELGHRAGARSVLVRTGYGRQEWEYHRASWPREPDFIAATLGDAVNWILEDAAKSGS